MNRQSVLVKQERGLYESRDHRFIARESFGTWEVRWVKKGGDVGSCIFPTLSDARAFVHHASRYFVNVA